MRRADNGLERPPVRKGSFAQSMKAVAWSFFGVRKGVDHESDFGRLNPLHVVIAGVVSAILFILALLLLVNWVLSSGVATSV